MLDLGWWPAFYVADVCIVLGVFALLVQTSRPQRVVTEGMA